MSKSVYSTYSTRKTPQSKPVPGRSDQVLNNAGGYVFAVDDWKRLDRFLILGSEGGTYYVKAPELTRKNADAVLRCIEADGIRTVNRIVEISDAGRAPKNDPALFALAMAIKLGDLDTRRAAAEALPRVARIGTHLFRFAQFMEQFGGWSKLTRNAVADWYTGKSGKSLAYQIVKYQQRDGWSHRDLLRLSHPKPPQDEEVCSALAWAVGREGVGHWENMPMIIYAFVKAKTATEQETIRLIIDHGLTREMINTKHLNSARVWDALLAKMPLTAMIRNLGKMTQVGLLKDLSEASVTVMGKLLDQEYLAKSRVHPLNVLVALKTYAQGQGMRGSLKWNPVARVVDALDEAFYLSFGNVTPTGKRMYLALDVSGSMGSQISGMPISCREAAAAMALVTARVEPNWMIVGFQSKLVPLNISPRQRLDDVVRSIYGLNFGSTDCSAPMIDAVNRGLDVDLFSVYTDNETWSGHIHPFQALQNYRRKRSIPAKLVTVGMTSSGFTIADPTDAGMLDVVGFDTATPNVIADFAQS